MSKVRSHGEISFDENGYKKRAACVVFKDDTEDEVLLITSRHFDEATNKAWWILPGGSVEENEEPIQAAAREVCEESGIKGDIARFLGQVVNDETLTRTWVYVMHATHQLDHWDDKILGRQRQWFTPEKAKELLAIHKPGFVQYIDIAKQIKGNRCMISHDVCCGDSY